MNMKCQIRRLQLFALAIVLPGCTLIALDMDTGSNNIPSRHILTDKILAIGKPDAALLKKMELSNTIAFIGEKNTYMFYLGGEELEQISKLKLDGRRMHVESTKELYLKDKQIWGKINLLYSAKGEISAADMAELKLGGFAPDKRQIDRRGAVWSKDHEDDGENVAYFSNTIRIEGVVYPAIQIPDQQISKLQIQRSFSLYDPKEPSPPIMGKIIKVPLVAGAVAVDIVLAPVYLGMGVYLLVLHSN